jgi:hypothetical protein
MKEKSSSSLSFVSFQDARYRSAVSVYHMMMAWEQVLKIGEISFNTTTPV